MEISTNGNLITVFEDMESWSAERDTLQACAKAFSNGEFSNAYSNSYNRKHDGPTFPEYIQSIIDKFGFERVCLVMAATVRSAPWDGRYYPSVREWASTVKPFPQSPIWQQHKRDDYSLKPADQTDILINSHPVFINDACSLLISKEKEQPPEKQQEGSER